MITIPQNFQGDDQSLLQPERFRELVKLFNRLETDLQYPNCEGNEDARRNILDFNKVVLFRRNKQGVIKYALVGTWIDKLAIWAYNTCID